MSLKDKNYFGAKALANGLEKASIDIELAIRGLRAEALTIKCINSDYSVVERLQRVQGELSGWYTDISAFPAVKRIPIPRPIPVKKP